MGKETIKTEVTKNQNAIERDIDSIAECIGDIRKYLTLLHAWWMGNNFYSTWTK